ncbi:MAG: hypothetical protein HPY76_04105 [Anaerolineae bacterium]|nr:hypothetical protein [Anaerolineae bacterium]
MPSDRIVVPLVIIIVLSACAPPVYTPPAPPEILLVQISPSLAWITTTMNTCALRYGNIGLVVDEVSHPDPDGESIIIQIGEAGIPANTSYVIGAIDLVIIVNSQNPLDAIDYDTLRSIYDGSISTWQQIGMDAGAIGLWHYPEELDMRKLTSEALDVTFLPTLPAGIAPNPDAMLALVANDPNALGYVPISIVNDSVKTLSLSGFDASKLNFPILAYSLNELTSEQKIWLGCLADEVGKQ